MKILRALAFSLTLFLPAAASAQEAALSKGQTVYLPVYSHIYYGSLDRKGKPSKVLLSAMVSIRNTDAKRGIRVTSARYYNTEGKLLRELVGKPTNIAAFGTIELFVEQHDDTGGSGANFVIVWDAEAPANPPVIEAVHAAFEGARSVLFSTTGTPIRPE